MHLTPGTCRLRQINQGKTSSEETSGGVGGEGGGETETDGEEETDMPAAGGER